MSSQRDELDFDYGGDMQQAWEGGLGNLSGAGAAFQEKMLQFDADGLPLLDPYVFGGWSRLHYTSHAYPNCLSQNLKTSTWDPRRLRDRISMMRRHS